MQQIICALAGAVPYQVRRDGMALMGRFRPAADQRAPPKDRGASCPTQSGPASSHYSGGVSESRQAGDGGLANKRLSYSLNKIFSLHGSVPPPSKLEVFLFWVVGIVITIFSGSVVIYASHLHIWG
jgi:hypothetical protein